MSLCSLTDLLLKVYLYMTLPDYTDTRLLFRSLQPHTHIHTHSVMALWQHSSCVQILLCGFIITGLLFTVEREHRVLSSWVKGLNRFWLHMKVCVCLYVSMSQWGSEQVSFFLTLDVLYASACKCMFVFFLCVY